MEKLSHNYHAKLQEMCDCYMDTDFLAEMKREIPVESATLEEEAIRYFALLILYTLTVKAQQLSVKKKRGALQVTVTSPQEEKKSLSPPPEEIVDKILALTKDKDYLQNKSKQTQVHGYERQIDQMVYNLYGLTPEEIKIVKGQ